MYLSRIGSDRRTVREWGTLLRNIGDGLGVDLKIGMMRQEVKQAYEVVFKAVEPDSYSADVRAHDLSRTAWTYI